MIKVPGIYKITNLINGKAYVGKTENIITRWPYHFSVAKQIKNGKKPKGANPLHYAMLKYGIENFKFEIIQFFIDGVPSITALSTFEIFYIAHHNTFIQDGHGYNLTKGGEGITGKRHSEITKQKIRESNLGKIVSEESKELNRKAHLGKKMPKEYSAKMSMLISGERNGMYGKHHSVQSKEKNRQSHLGKIQTSKKVCKPVICVDTGEYFISTRQVSEYLKINKSTTRVNILNGKLIKNKLYKYITWDDFDTLISQYPDMERRPAL